MVRTRSKSEEKRESILDAASRLFTDQGFAATSMDKVAKAAGVSKQTVYSHFGNKDELFTASIEAKCNSFKMSGAFEADLHNPRATLIALAGQFIELVLSKEARSVHRTCVTESDTNPHIARLFFAAGPQKVIAKVAELMAGFNAVGVLKIEQPDMASIQFLQLIQGEVKMRSELNIEPQWSEEKIHAYVENCVDLFLRGYGV